MRLFGSQDQLANFLNQGPEPRQGHRQATSITLRQDGTSTRIPMEQLVSLTLSRELLTGSLLPPYIAVSQYRFGATAVLTTGAQVTTDYINLGTMVLPGHTAHGRVDIPWQDIQTVRFQR